MRTNVLEIILLARVLQIYSCAISTRPYLTDDDQISLIPSSGTGSKTPIDQFYEILDSLQANSCDISERFSLHTKNSSSPLGQSREIYYSTRKKYNTLGSIVRTSDSNVEEFEIKNFPDTNQEHNGMVENPLRKQAKNSVQNKVERFRRRLQGQSFKTENKWSKNLVSGNGQQWGSASRMSSINTELGNKRFRRDNSRRLLIRIRSTMDSSLRRTVPDGSKFRKEFDFASLACKNRQVAYRRLTESSTKQSRRENIKRSLYNRRVVEPSLIRLRNNARFSVARLKFSRYDSSTSIQSGKGFRTRTIKNTNEYKGLNKNLDFNSYTEIDNVPSKGKLGNFQSFIRQTRRIDVRFRLGKHRNTLNHRITLESNDMLENYEHKVKSENFRNIPVLSQSHLRRLENRREVRRSEISRQVRSRRENVRMSSSQQLTFTYTTKTPERQQRNARENRMMRRQVINGIRRHTETASETNTLPKISQEIDQVTNAKGHEHSNGEIRSILQHVRMSINSKNWFYEKLSSCLLEVTLGLFALLTFFGESGTKKRLHFTNVVKPILSHFGF